jgi:hypothetical protein
MKVASVGACLDSDSDADHDKSMAHKHTMVRT